MSDSKPFGRTIGVGLQSGPYRGVAFLERVQCEPRAAPPRRSSCGGNRTGIAEEGHRWSKSVGSGPATPIRAEASRTTKARSPSRDWDRPILLHCASRKPRASIRAAAGVHEHHDESRTPTGTSADRWHDRHHGYRRPDEHARPGDCDASRLHANGQNQGVHHYGLGVHQRYQRYGDDHHDDALRVPGGIRRPCRREGDPGVRHDLERSQRSHRQEDIRAGGRSQQAGRTARGCRLGRDRSGQ